VVLEDVCIDVEIRFSAKLDRDSFAFMAKSTTSFDAALTTIQQHLGAIEKVIGSLALGAMSDDERLHAGGGLRKGEQDSMTCLFDAADAIPGPFMSLADKDGGKDPEKLETYPARDALARAVAISPVTAKLDLIRRALGDDLLTSLHDAREFASSLYMIAKANAPANAKLKARIAKATSFHGAAARKAIVTKKKKAAKSGPANG
jgi:hypothetical protein